MSADFSRRRQQLWRLYASLGRMLRLLQRSEPMVPGSFYLLRRQCGKPNCRCTRGHLHASWVLTRSEQGQDCIYSIRAAERAKLRALSAEYRRYQRARAAYVKLQGSLLRRVDELATKRIVPWPEPGRRLPQ